MPKARRRFAQPNATPPHVVEIVLAEAVARPTPWRLPTPGAPGGAERDAVGEEQRSSAMGEQRLMEGGAVPTSPLVRLSARSGLAAERTPRPKASTGPRL